MPRLVCKLGLKTSLSLSVNLPATCKLQPLKLHKLIVGMKIIQCEFLKKYTISIINQVLFVHVIRAKKALFKRNI